MKTITMLTFLIALAFWLGPTPAAAEEIVLAETAPTWNTGDNWKFRTEKDLDRTVIQNLGLLEITMRLDKVTSTTSYTVAGTETLEGEECYVLRFTGDQRIIGEYNTKPAEGETAGGDLVETATFEGSEYRRTSDLAFVKAIIRSKGVIEIGGLLGGSPTPFESNSITNANPPIRQFQFPMIKGDSWHISSALTTSTSGTSSDSVVTTFSYDCRVIGRRTIRLDNGETYECVAISQEGTQTTQSQNSGINIDDIRGALFFAPAVGNKVRDEAEGQELLEYAPGGISPKNR
ncbi:MAG: hypothetical protein JSV16_10790 [Candidatus Hydrogenedentota bacterium]|nr:MAG: hypothetical protein JSV16_10790 [Candidatus Hydrogenedentota bacterium]